MSTKVLIGNLCLAMLTLYSCQNKPRYEYQLKNTYTENIRMIEELALTKDSKNCGDKLRDFNNALFLLPSLQLKEFFGNEIQLIEDDLRQAQNHIEKIIQSKDDKDCLAGLYKLHYEVKGLRQVAHIAKQIAPEEISLNTDLLAPGDIILLKRLYSPRYINPESYLHQYTDVLVVGNKNENKHETFGSIASKRINNTSILEKVIKENDPLISNILILRLKQRSTDFLSEIKIKIDTNENQEHFLYSDDLNKSFTGKILITLDKLNIGQKDKLYSLNDEITELFQLKEITSPFALQFNNNIETVAEIISPNIYLDHYIEIFMLYLFKIKDQPRFIHDIRQEYSRLKKTEEEKGSNLSEVDTKNKINNEIFRSYINNALKKIAKTYSLSHRNFKTKNDRLKEFKELKYPVSL